MANIIDRTRNALKVLRHGLPWEGVATPTGYSAVKAAPYVWSPYRDREPQWHINNFRSYAQEGFNKNTLIYSAIMYKVRSMTVAPLRAWTGDPDYPAAVDPDHPLAKLLARPNPHQSWVEFHGQSVAYLNIAGNNYVYFDRGKSDEGIPEAMYTLRPDRVYVVPENPKGRKRDKGGAGITGYYYVPEGSALRDGVPILPKNLMHTKLPNPTDIFEGMGYGLSPVAPLAQVGDTDNEVTRFLKLFFESGLMPNVLLKFKVPLTDPTIAKIRARWAEIYGGGEGWIKPGVLDSGGEVERLSWTFDELGFEAIDERSESRILQCFGVPPILVGSRVGLAKATYSNYELARRAFWQDTMVPESTLFEVDYQYFLNDDDVFVGFDYSQVPALRANIPALAIAAKDLWAIGVPANAALDAVGLSQAVGEVPGGDVGYVSAGVFPSGSSAEPAETQPTTEGAATAEDEQRSCPDCGGQVKSLRLSDDLPTYLKVWQCQVCDKVLFDEPVKKNRPLTFERKQTLRDKVDAIAVKWEPRFQKQAKIAFERDRRALLARLRKSFQMALELKQSVSWSFVKHDWDEYFSQFAGESWRDQFMKVIEGVMTEQGEMWSAEFGMQFDVRNFFAEQWFDAYSLKFAQDILDTTKSDISLMLQQAMEHGWTIPEMEKQLKLTFDRWTDPDFTTEGRRLTDEELQWFNDRKPRYRREMIARTETIRASNAGSQALFKDWNVEQKTWQATGDNRTRLTHLRAWADYSIGGNEGPISIDEPFIVGNSELMYPGDPAGSAEEIINCRCVSLPHMAALPEFIPTDEEIAEERALIEATLAEREALAARRRTAGRAQQMRQEVLKVAEDGRARVADLQTEEDRIWKEHERLLSEAAISIERGEEIDRARLNVLLASLNDQIVSICKARRELRDSLLDRMRQPLLVENPANFNIRHVTRMTGARLESFNAGREGFSSLVDENLMAGATVRVKSTSGRSYANDYAISLSENPRGEKSIVHELGHVLEHHNLEVHRKAVEFLSKRTAGEDAEWLGDHFDEREVTRRDKFIDPYMGKHYPGARATEIISMGLELLYSEPDRLAREDPEYFDFMIDLLRGQ